MDPAATTTYTVTVTLGECSGTASTTVNVLPTPTANITVTETSGIASNDGTVCAGAPATLTATGAGTGGAYSWSYGLTTAAITVNPTANTTYTVTVNNAQGCTANTGTTITATPLPSITFNTPTPNTACTAPFTGAVSISSPTGANYNYAWSNGAATTGISAVNGGDYTVTVTNTTTNCSNAATVNIPNNTPAPNITIAATASPTSCGGSNGSITLGNLTPNFNYTVNYTKNGAPQTPFNTNANSSGQIVISGLGAGSYTGIFVTISGCQSNQVAISLSNPQAPTITASSNSPVCVGSNITLTSAPLGGSGIYNSYVWSGPNGYASLLQNPVPFNVTATGTPTYSVAVTDSNGCTGSGSTTVTVNPAATANITVAETSGTTNNDGIICTGASATLTATGGNNYQWSNGSSGNSITVTPGTTIIYNVTITNAQGCTASDSQVITVQTCTTPCPNPPTVNINPPGASICGLQNQALNITLGGSATTATLNETGFGSLSAGSVNAPGNVVTYTPAANDLGNSVQVTATTTDPDGTGPCTAASFTATLQYVNLPNANFTGIADNEVCLGTPETLTPTVPGGNWSSSNEAVATVNPSSGQVTGVAAGTATITYTVTQNGCTNSSTKTITIAACNCTTPATFTITPGSVPPVCGLAPQSFTLAFGPNTTLLTVTQNGAGSVSTSTFNTTGSFTYTPQPADFGDTVTITITSNDPDLGNPSCSATIETVELTFNAVPTVEPITGTDNVCVGATISLFSATPGGMWSSSIPTVAAVNPSSGQVTGVAVGTVTITYTVIQNGCSSSQTKIVTVNQLPNANAGNNQTICAGSSATLTASGAGLDGSYAWSNGGSGNTITVSPSDTTTYTVTVTNANGCTDTDAATVNVVSLPTASISGTTTICSGGSTNINFTGTPNATVTYNIGGGSNQTITLNAFGTATVNTGALTAGTAYNLVSVTSSGSTPCTQALSGFAGITIVSLPTAGITASALAVCWGSSATIIFTGTANATVTYNISGGSNQSIALDPSGMASLSTGNLTATATYNLVSVALTGGSVPCSAPLSGSVTVAVNQLPNANAGTDQTICAGSSATLTASGAGLGGIYEWSNGSLGSSITVSPDVTTTYTVTVTDSNGCKDEGQVVVVVTSDSGINTGGSSGAEPDIVCINNTDYVVSFFINGGTPPYLVNGVPVSGSFFSSPVLSNATFNFIVSDVMGCTATVTGTNTICQPQCVVNATFNTLYDINCKTGFEVNVEPGGPPQPPVYQYAVNDQPFQTSPQFTGLPPGLYVVNILTGCGQQNLGVYVHDPLTVQVQVTQAGAVFYGNATISGGASPYSILWSTGATGSSANLGALTGIATVVVTDGNGCVKLINLTQNGAVGIAQPPNDLTGSFTLFPNPAYGFFTLAAAQPLPQPAAVLLYSPIGQLIAQRRSRFEQPELFDTSLLPAGVYWVAVVSPVQYRIFKVWCR